LIGRFGFISQEGIALTGNPVNLFTSNYSFQKGKGFIPKLKRVYL